MTVGTCRICSAEFPSIQGRRYCEPCSTERDYQRRKAAKRAYRRTPSGKAAELARRRRRDTKLRAISQVYAHKPDRKTLERGLAAQERARQHAEHKRAKAASSALNAKRGRYAEKVLSRAPYDRSQPVRSFLMAAYDLGSEWHVDHIQPTSKGGTNHIDNLQLLRAELNRFKHAHTEGELLAIMKMMGIPASAYYNNRILAVDVLPEL